MDTPACTYLAHLAPFAQELVWLKFWRWAGARPAQPSDHWLWTGPMNGTAPCFTVETRSHNRRYSRRFSGRALAWALVHPETPPFTPFYTRQDMACPEYCIAPAHMLTARAKPQPGSRRSIARGHRAWIGRIGARGEALRAPVVTAQDLATARRPPLATVATVATFPRTEPPPPRGYCDRPYEMGYCRQPMLWDAKRELWVCPECLNFTTAFQSASHLARTPEYARWLHEERQRREA